jgi:hypothetical protein
MPTIQAFWNQLNANEKLVGYGIGLTVVSWIVGLIGGLGLGGGALIPAIVVGVIYWLKYNSKSPINWPLPVATLVLIITGIEALLTLISLLGFGLVLAVFGVVAFLALVINAIGAGVMAYGAWKEYQAMPRTTPPAPPAPPAA